MPEGSLGFEFLVPEIIKEMKFTSQIIMTRKEKIKLSNKCIFLRNLGILNYPVLWRGVKQNNIQPGFSPIPCMHVVVSG